MNVTHFFVVSIICMVTGHIFKIKRWGLFISVYEEPLEYNLLNSMALGHALNAILPIRAGDIVRVIWAGKKLKNGYPLSIATVLVDLYVDVITVGLMFFSLSAIGRGGEELLTVASAYKWIFVVVVPLTFLAAVFRKNVKKCIYVFAGFFNDRIKFEILYVSYLIIALLKDIIKNISKRKFVMYSIGIWSGYVASFVSFAEAVQRYGYHYTASDVFTKLFSGSSLYHIEKGLVNIWGGYLLLPLIICWMLSLVYRHGQNGCNNESRAALPQMNQADRLAFLKTYYAEENSEYVQTYLKVNRDVTVIEDNSAGSNASTLLVMKKDGNLFYRKYAFDEDGERLWEQMKWIESHQTDVPLPLIIEKKREKNYAAYDMHYYSSALGFFKYIHTMPVEMSWNILKKVLDALKNGLHIQNRRSADLKTIDQYINEKVIRNLQIILEKDKYIKGLERYDAIAVNGQYVPTLKFYLEALDKQHLQQIFINDIYSDIHGDLTIENIICLFDETEISATEYDAKIMPNAYYFIDPNTGNIHNSPFLDYAKLLQSLHGNYEFLMMVTSVAIDRDQVEYMLVNSENYKKLFEKYKEYLEKIFSRDEMLSIYYHEVIHWLRLLPYKIRKNEKTAVVFYTELLMILRDVWEFENDK